MSNVLSEKSVARMVGVRVGVVRRWRERNDEAQALRAGPPYTFVGGTAWYPTRLFWRWCTLVEKVDGIPLMRLPASSPQARSWYRATPAR